MSGRDPTSFSPARTACTSPAYVASELARNAAREAEGDAAIADLLEFLAEMKRVEAPVATDSCLPAAPSAEVDVSTVHTVTLDPESVVSIMVEPSPDLPETAIGPRRAKAAYEFPGVRCSPTDWLTLREELDVLTKEFNATNDYVRVRDRFCAISVALNAHGLWAPQYRTQPRVRPASAGKRPVPALHLDHLVIDAHWLWARKHSAPFSGKYQDLLSPGQPFDFDLAAAYAQEDWTSDFRAEEIFSLPSRVQWQLCTTKSKSCVERQADLLQGRRNATGKGRTPARVAPIKKAIANWSDGNHRIRGHEQAYANLWVAREMLGTKGTGKDFGELAGLIAGEAPLDASTVRLKLKGLDRRLGLPT